MALARAQKSKPVIPIDVILPFINELNLFPLVLSTIIAEYYQERL